MMRALPVVLGLVTPSVAGIGSGKSGRSWREYFSSLSSSEQVYFPHDLDLDEDRSDQIFIPLGLIGHTLPFIGDRVDTLQLLSSLLLEEEPENQTIEQLPEMYLTRDETIRYLTDNAVYQIVNQFATHPTIFPVVREGWLNLSHRQVSALTPAFSRLTDMRSLSLGHTHVVDIRPLQPLTNLLYLYLSDTPVADIGPMYALRNLRVLHVSHTRITNIGPLQSLMDLWYLDLSDTLVSSIGPLGSLTNLRELDLSHTPVTDLGPLSNINPVVYILPSVQQQDAMQAIAAAANSQVGLWSQVRLFEPFSLPSSANEHTTIGKMGDYDVKARGSGGIFVVIRVYLIKSASLVPINNH